MIGRGDALLLACALAGQTASSAPLLRRPCAPLNSALRSSKKRKRKRRETGPQVRRPRVRCACGLRWQFRIGGAWNVETARRRRALAAAEHRCAARRAPERFRLPATAPMQNANGAKIRSEDPPSTTTRATPPAQSPPTQPAIGNRPRKTRLFPSTRPPPEPHADPKRLPAACDRRDLSTQGAPAISGSLLTASEDSCAAPRPAPGGDRSIPLPFPGRR